MFEYFEATIKLVHSFQYTDILNAPTIYIDMTNQFGF